VIERLVDELLRSSTSGAVGPIIVNDDERLTVQAAGVALRASFPAPRGLGKGTPYDIARMRTFRFDFLQGSCLLVRGAAFAQINGMDPDFFFYAEDADLMVRLKAAGFVTSLVREAYVQHRQSSTIGWGSERQAYALVRSMLIFFTGRWGGHSGSWAPGYTAPDFTAHR